VRFWIFVIRLVSLDLMKSPGQHKKHLKVPECGPLWVPYCSCSGNIRVAVQIQLYDWKEVY